MKNAGEQIAEILSLPKPGQAMIDEKWTDLDGNTHRRYTVRSAGNGFFMPVDVLTNSCPIANGDTAFTSRKEAWDWLRTRAQ